VTVTVPVAALSLGGTSVAAAKFAFNVTVSASTGEAAAKQVARASPAMLVRTIFICVMFSSLRVGIVRIIACPRSTTPPLNTGADSTVPHAENPSSGPEIQC